MPAFTARVAGDSFDDVIEATSAVEAARTFAQKISDEDCCLDDDGDTVIIEVCENGDWFKQVRFEATAVVTTKIDINPIV